MVKLQDYWDMSPHTHQNRGRSLEFCWCLLACSRHIARSCWALCLRFQSLASTFRPSLSSDITAYTVTHHTCKCGLCVRQNLAPRVLLGSLPSLSKPGLHLSTVDCMLRRRTASRSNVDCTCDKIPPLETRPTITHVIAF